MTITFADPAHLPLLCLALAVFGIFTIASLLDAKQDAAYQRDARRDLETSLAVLDPALAKAFPNGLGGIDRRRIVHLADIKRGQDRDRQESIELRDSLDRLAQLRKDYRP